MCRRVMEHSSKSGTSPTTYNSPPFRSCGTFSGESETEGGVTIDRRHKYKGITTQTLCQRRESAGFVNIKTTDREIHTKEY